MVNIDPAKRDNTPDPPPAPTVGACTILAAIFVITIVLIIVFWALIV
jgi:hypothetical protein